MTRSTIGQADGDIDTIGGLAAVLAGHVPQKGECITQW